MDINNIILISAATTTGLVAGLYVGFVISVNLGNSRLENKEYLKTMQFINQEIQNPIFIGYFLGSLILLPVTTWLNFDILLLFATVLNTIGSYAITFTRNIPLNEKLDKLVLDDLSDTEIEEVRGWYEGPWNQWHLIRTICSTAAFVLILIATIN
ncbi:MAG: DUF1772 domain-containing protein [Candidatus Heimdallarchaeota archaeon]|nr:DUF1772 domain-containing protein [Candidatus Heimdallarchaeota archaeon]